MIGERIKELRTQNGLTQKALADKLFVTAQAVSRWEQNEVEPSVSTLTELAKLFNVSIDELVVGEKPQAEETETKETEVAEEKEPVPQEPPKPVLAVCEQCNRPIYNGYEIVRQTIRVKKKNASPKDPGTIRTRVICKNCERKNKEKAEKEKEAARKYMADCGAANRRKSFWISGVICGISLAVFLIIMFTGNFQVGLIGSIISAVLFPFISCLCLQNNIIFNMIAYISSFGFVRFPGLIFSLDLEGIIWLLTVKLLFWILGLLLAVGFFLLGVALGIIFSIFVYPYALVKNKRHPEDWEKSDLSDLFD